MILSRFRWYRRARGGYWAQVTSPLGVLWKVKWVRCIDRSQPTPDMIWEFYPWASKKMSNGYIDEWHSVKPFYAVPLSTVTRRLVAAAKAEIETGECPNPVEYHPCQRDECTHCGLVNALKLFED